MKKTNQKHPEASSPSSVEVAPVGPLSQLPQPTTVAPAEQPIPPASDLPKSPEEWDPTPQQEVLALLLHHGRDLFRANEMSKFFGRSKTLFKQCQKANWISSRHSGNRFTGYHLVDVVQCLRRLRREGRPGKSPEKPAKPNTN